MLAHAAMDNKGNALLYYALWTVMYFVVVIEQSFGIDVPDVDQIIKRGGSVNDRLGIVSASQEAAVLKLRAERAIAK